MPVITNYAKIMYSLGEQRELLDNNRPPSVTESRETSLWNTCLSLHSKKREKTSTVLPFAYLNAMWCGAQANASACPSQYLFWALQRKEDGFTACLLTAGQEHIRHRLRSSALKLDKSTSFPRSFDKAAREMRAAKRLLGRRAERSRVTGLRSQRVGFWQGLGEGTETPAWALG